MPITVTATATRLWRDETLSVLTKEMSALSAIWSDPNTAINSVGFTSCQEAREGLWRIYMHSFLFCKVAVRTVCVFFQDKRKSMVQQKSQKSFWKYTIKINKIKLILLCWVVGLNCSKPNHCYKRRQIPLKPTHRRFCTVPMISNVEHFSSVRTSNWTIQNLL